VRLAGDDAEAAGHVRHVREEDAGLEEPGRRADGEQEERRREQHHEDEPPARRILRGEREVWVSSKS
jgi:hypothetical protein